MRREGIESGDEIVAEMKGAPTAVERERTRQSRPRQARRQRRQSDRILCAPRKFRCRVYVAGARRRRVRQQSHAQGRNLKGQQMT